jgi:hypothetical protein
MKNFSVLYRYNGLTRVLKMQAESHEQAREHMLVFMGSKEEPRILCDGDATAELKVEQAN